MIISLKSTASVPRLMAEIAPSNTSRSLDKAILNRSQSHVEDKFPSNDIWRINYRAGIILEGPR